MMFCIPGKAVGKGRPRFSTAGGFPRTFTPGKTVEYENLVRLAWIQSGSAKLSGALYVFIKAIFTPPKSTSKKKRAAMIGTGYCHKPDCDNIAKSILDALNGIAYDDDAQVVEIAVKKVYGEADETIVCIDTTPQSW